MSKPQKTLAAETETKIHSRLGLDLFGYESFEQYLQNLNGLYGLNYRETESYTLETNEKHKESIVRALLDEVIELKTSERVTSEVINAYQYFVLKDKLTMTNEVIESSVLLSRREENGKAKSDHHFTSRLPPSFKPASVRVVTPSDGKFIGIGFDHNGSTSLFSLSNKDASELASLIGHHIRHEQSKTAI